jgi:hypothetical protein
MPKIPVFQAQGTITPETGAQTIGVQAPLSMAGALAPLQKQIANYGAKERIIQEKTEALKLENESITELNDVVFEASKMMNKQEANAFLKSESARIRDKYRSRASSRSVQNIFDNNYLLEEQKQIYKVDGAVFKNIIQNNQNEKSKKRERILTEGLYGKNPLQESQLISDLTKLEDEDIIQDDDTRASNIAAIPGTIDYFRAKKQITENPEQANVLLNDANNFKNLTLKARQELIRESRALASSKVQEDVKNRLTGLANGEDIPINEEAVKTVLGPQAYKNYKEEESGLKQIVGLSKEILTSEVGQESVIANKFKVRPENYAQDTKLKQTLAKTIEKKNELIDKDPATLVIQGDDKLREYYQDYVNEKNPEFKALKQKFFNDYVVDSQRRMKIPESKIRPLPDAQSKAMVVQYNNLDAKQKIGFLKSLEYSHGDNYDKVIGQLTKDGLPVTAELASYFGDETLSKKMMSIDSKEERKILDNYLKGANIKKEDVRKDVANELVDFRQAVMSGNTRNTSLANKKLNQIEDTIMYLAINEMSTGQVSQKDAITNAVNIVKNNFVVKDTYFIPRIYDNKKLNNKQIEFIEKKTQLIKDHYLMEFGAAAFASEKEKDAGLINNRMLLQMRENGVWVNSADGKGLVFAIKFNDGSLGLVQNKKGDLLQVNFDDDSYKIPGSDKDMDFEIEQKQNIYAGYGGSGYTNVAPKQVKQKIPGTTMKGR